MSVCTYGYARVSSLDQNLDRQIDALLAFGVERGNIFLDKASGKDFERPAYRKLSRTLKRGDVLVVKSIDRLGRNYDEILSEWRMLTAERDVAIVVLDTPLLDTRVTKSNVTGKLISDIVLQLLSYVAHLERDNIRQRQAEGIASAKARGVRFGRPPIERPAHLPETMTAYFEGTLSRKEAARELSISCTTFDRWAKDWTSSSTR